MIRRFLAAIALASIVTSAAFAQAEIQKPGNGVTPPQLVSRVNPKYTPAAMKAKIEGSVWLDCVVGIEGDITDVKVSRSLDTQYGLDDAAVAAAKQWKFKPGQKDGKPVPVRITLELTFTLRK